MSKLLTMLLIALSIAFVSCNRGSVKPVEMGELETYTDEITELEVKYPENWHILKSNGDFFWAFSDSLARRRFSQYDAEGFPGARIAVFAKTIDTLQNRYENLIKVFGSEKFGPEFYTEVDTSFMIDGVKGFKYAYEFERLDGLFKGMTFIATPDSITVSILQLESFAGTFDELYKPKFDQIVNDFKLAQTVQFIPDTLYEEIEADPPSANLKTVRGTGFSIQIPDNFGKERDQWKTASSLESYLYLGDRRGDSQIKVEIFDAENATLDNIVEENKAAFGNAEPQKTTLSGQEAFVMNYRPGADLSGKVWFVKNNDKLYRVLITWYVPEAADYQSIFENVVSTFSFE